ncbi:MAG: DUF4190 domain-containing protein [Isosphaeraceae bacterium]|nr:DUF4190 domain-containing protein [Isosphaeraceae bacterium]
MAIASLICGLLGCIPIITGLLAVIFGIVGLRKTRDPYVSGKGMAIAGLVLGLVSLIGWGLFGVGLVAIWPQFQAGFRLGTGMPTAAEPFLRDLANDDIDAALARCIKGMDRAQLVAAAEELRPLGKLREVQITSQSMSTTDGAPRGNLGGQAIFDKGTKSYRLEFVVEDDAVKIADFAFD